MPSQPFLSLCIPTNGAVEWVKRTLESIYCQGVDNSLFEVIISDNGDSDSLEREILQYSYPNLHYARTEEEGFLNQIASFRMSRGVFIKMLNHRSCLKPGALSDIVALIQRFASEKPIMYFSDGRIDGTDVIACDGSDEFVRTLSYWISWSAGVGMWDVDKPQLENIKPNKMFPHISLLFDIRQNAQYVIWNKCFQEMQADDGKGGYDVFHTFAVDFLDLTKGLVEKKAISELTFGKLKKDLFYFLCGIYTDEVIRAKSTLHTYIIRDIKESMSKYYGVAGYCFMLIRQHMAHYKNLLFR